MLETIELPTLSQYLTLTTEIDWERTNIPTCKIPHWTPGMQANASFFSDPEYGRKYFELENSSQAFGNRWRAAIGSWDRKVVVDIGCGPGNVYAAVGGSPQIFGIDISHGALEHAMQVGYTPLLADAHNLPFIDGFADIVTLNAVLHHCDDMARVLTEAARLVRPGGVLITDEDPLSNNETYQGLALLVIEARARFPMYWLPGRSKVYKSPEEQAWRLATEIHNSKPGDGVTPELYINTLEPLGFEIELYPHYHNVGDELFRGEQGKLGFKDTLIQILAGANAPKPPQSIACIAKRVRG
ncbi:class I SAM-dependent methyltransferase [Chamaesiphon sp. VAR_48_metabat_135_sub]|uniref:class I SAM-dependent methyltransferase n=1 Tax=Chamaesiphon sp. VAR_48_metabat_135_sub TaxID=2964699 RepID=UPI00286B2E4C|nr:class I SAM-dependent methyltransferase [Chamaesiphon sp. VAR_48_metabat_135_sub]